METPSQELSGDTLCSCPMIGDEGAARLFPFLDCVGILGPVLQGALPL
jgi:hypothetical protein